MALGIHGAAFASTGAVIDFETIVIIIGLIACLTYLAVNAIQCEWRRLFSLIVAFPMCYVIFSFLHVLGLDGAQAAFWVTYPYYRTQVESDAAHSFAWGEGGIFLGGEWVNNLVYDPLESDWNSTAGPMQPTKDAIGLGEVKKITKSGSDDCEIKVLKRLGGHWFFEQQTYGGGFICQ